MLRQGGDLGVAVDLGGALGAAGGDLNSPSGGTSLAFGGSRSSGHGAAGKGSRKVNPRPAGRVQRSKAALGLAGVLRVVALDLDHEFVVPRHATTAGAEGRKLLMTPDDCAACSLRFAPEQGPDQPARIKADRRGNVQELQHVEAPVSALVFRHVGRRLAETLRHHRLRQTGRFAPSYEQLSQLLMAFGVDGL